MARSSSTRRSSVSRSRHALRPQLDPLEGRTLLATFSVTNTDDSGPGSLRTAIELANATANSPANAPDVIAFDIPGAGVQTIRPLSTLPVITDPVVIDGYTQGTISTPGDPSDDARPNTLAVGNDARLLIEIDGSLAGLANGLSIDAGSSTVRGLVINRFQARGISLTTLGGNVIEGNFIGTDPSGTLPLGNGITGPDRYAGIQSLSKDGSYVAGVADSNRIGTDGNGVGDAGERNLVSANGSGITLSSRYNVVAGNYIGTDASGNVALGNLIDGVLVYFYSTPRSPCSTASAQTATASPTPPSATSSPATRAPGSSFSGTPTWWRATTSAPTPRGCWRWETPAASH